MPRDQVGLRPGKPRRLRTRRSRSRTRSGKARHRRTISLAAEKTREDKNPAASHHKNPRQTRNRKRRPQPGQRHRERPSAADPEGETVTLCASVQCGREVLLGRPGHEHHARARTQVHTHAHGCTCMHTGAHAQCWINPSLDWALPGPTAPGAAAVQGGLALEASGESTGRSASAPRACAWRLREPHALGPLGRGGWSRDPEDSVIPAPATCGGRARGVIGPHGGQCGLPAQSDTTAAGGAAGGDRPAEQDRSHSPACPQPRRSLRTVPPGSAQPRVPALGAEPGERCRWVSDEGSSPEDESRAAWACYRHSRERRGPQGALRGSLFLVAPVGVSRAAA